MNFSAFVIAAALGWMAISGGHAASKTALTIGMGSTDAGPLDPHRSAGTPDKVLFNWMFNGLVRFKPGSMDPEQIEGDLAERWQASPDGKIWTFTLRTGVQCHRGYGELTATDVVYSLERAADPKRSIFSSDYGAFERVEAIDPRTVRISLKRAVPSLLGLVVNYHGGHIVCRKAAEELGDAFRQNPVGTGPFAFAAYKPKESVTLVANLGYFRGSPALERIIFRYVSSDASRDLAFTAGELDLTYGQSDQAWIDRMAKLPNVAVDVFDPSELGLLILNVTKPPLDDIRVRRAIAHAVNRPELVRFRGERAAREGKSVVPIGYLGYTADVPLLPHDTSRAGALLKEAGHANGIAVKSIVTNLSNGLTLMQVIQGQLRRSGIALDLEVVEHATYHQKIRQDLSPIVYYAAARFPLADIYLTQFFHSRSIVGQPTAVTNFSHCRTADAAIDAAAGEPDPTRQKALWREAQRLLIAEVCAVPLIEVPRVWARRTDLDYGHRLTGSLSNGPALDEKTRFR